MRAPFALGCMLASRVPQVSGMPLGVNLETKGSMKPLVLLATLILGGEAWPAPAQSTEGVAGRLVGTWRLVSSSQRMADGTVRPDPQTGPRGTGYIMYSETGRMCAVLANPDRPRWKSETAPLEAEVRAAFGGLVAYCGSYEVNEAQGYVVHHIEMDIVPNLTGTDRKRYVALVGGRLVLRPTPLPAGVQEWTVEWERVTKK